MRNKQAKKLQHKINKEVKALNKNIYDDDLWLGRFTAHQIRSDYYEFPDSSGGILTVWIKLLDKRHNIEKTIKLQALTGCQINFFAYDLWREMNDFICDDCQTWEKDDVRNDRINYRKE